MPRSPFARAALSFAVALLLVLASGTPRAAAELDKETWKAVSERFDSLFSGPGNDVEKASLVKLLMEDGQSRAWRLLATALVRECEIWWDIHKQLDQVSGEHSKLLAKTGEQGGYTPEQEGTAAELEAKLKDLEGVARSEQKALDAVVGLIRDGPQALRENILKRGGSSDWPYRAAAARIAGANPAEAKNAKYLNNVFASEKDTRVRSAALDSLAEAAEGWENFVLGRLGDRSWAIQLQAVKIASARKLAAAVPHMINALSLASPRVQAEMGAALKELTGENFDPYFEVWSKWWEDHKEQFQGAPKVRGNKSNDDPQRGDVEFYGLRVKSDKILFIIDISSSMKLPTKNDNPMDRWKPAPNVTGEGGRPPPPPPPEEILSGPKIDVEKHELKKAVQKLPKETMFNIIAFNHTAKQWQPKMMPATDANKKDAYKWIRALKPKGNTYIDGALRLGFRLAGLVNFDKAYPDIHVDTIVLLSDGAPTDNSFNAKFMDPNIILEHVREWNAKQHVVIHCIGVDLVETIDFLKKLAEENGGTYVDR